MTGPCACGCENAGFKVSEMTAELVAEWCGRLDRFCAELEGQGFGIERDGLSVRITLPKADG